MYRAGILIQRIGIDNARPEQLKLLRQWRSDRPSGKAFDTKERHAIKDAGNDNRSNLDPARARDAQYDHQQQRR
jgi:hypothetical protein